MFWLRKRPATVSPNHYAAHKDRGSSDAYPSPEDLNQGHILISSGV